VLEETPEPGQHATPAAYTTIVRGGTRPCCESACVDGLAAAAPDDNELLVKMKRSHLKPVEGSVQTRCTALWNPRASACVTFTFSYRIGWRTQLSLRCGLSKI
jgi:hypothetical protein